MKTKFKEGDKVLLAERGVHKAESKDWTLGGSQPEKYMVHFCKEYTVARALIIATEEGEVEFIELDGMLFSHPADKFTIKPDAVLIVLRRPQDVKSIEKFLLSKGYKWYSKTPIASRIINVHIDDRLKGQLTYDAQVTYHLGTKLAIKWALRFARKRFDHDNFVIIKTKPSVKKAIVELSKYI